MTAVGPEKTVLTFCRHVFQGSAPRSRAFVDFRVGRVREHHERRHVSGLGARAAGSRLESSSDRGSLRSFSGPTQRLDVCLPLGCLPSLLHLSIFESVELREHHERRYVSGLGARAAGSCLESSSDRGSLRSFSGPTQRLDVCLPPSLGCLPSSFLDVCLPPFLAFLVFPPKGGCLLYGLCPRFAGSRVRWPRRIGVNPERALEFRPQLFDRSRRNLRSVDRDELERRERAQPEQAVVGDSSVGEV